MAVERPNSERRSERRRRTRRSGTIHFNNRQANINCAIANLSNRGSKLKFESRVDCPESLVLVIGIGQLAEEPIECQVIWRDNFHVGVRFTKERVPPPTD